MNSKLIPCLALVLGGLALCGAGLWLLLSPAQYAATARIKIEQDDEASYDPQFFQTSLEIIQSELVLTNVVAGLNLNDVWGKKYSNGEPLKYAKCYAILRHHLRLTLVRNTKFIDITYYSDNPKEAADVANAVGASYRKYRAESRKALTIEGLGKLQQQFHDREKQIWMLQTNVEQLRKKYGIQDGASNTLPEQQPYWDGKRQLDQLTNLHRLLASKFMAVKVDASLPPASNVQMISPAESPKAPVGPHRPLGAVLLAVGLFPLLGGILLLKPKS